MKPSPQAQGCATRSPTRGAMLRRSGTDRYASAPAGRGPTLASRPDRSASARRMAPATSEKPARRVTLCYLIHRLPLRRAARGSVWIDTVLLSSW